MKKIFKALMLVIGLSVGAHAANAPTAALLGIGAAGAYTGNSTFTLVDQYNVPASLILNGITVTGALNTVGNQTNVGTQTNTGTQINNGPVTNNSSETSVGITVYQPATLTVSTFTQINANLGTYINLQSTGIAPVLLQGGNAGNLTPTQGTCAISTTTATNGQILVLGSTTTVNNVVIATGTAACISTTIAPLTTLNRTFMLFFDSALGLWKGN